MGINIKNNINSLLHLYEKRHKMLAFNAKNASFSTKTQHSRMDLLSFQ